MTKKEHVMFIYVAIAGDINMITKEDSKEDSKM
jgi:hypothetical protein